MAKTQQSGLTLELIEAWQANHRINLLLIDKITDEGMLQTLSKRGGRGVTGEFAHMHNNRVWHLQKRAKDLAQGLTIFETKSLPSKAALRKAMKASTKGIQDLLTGILNQEPKRRGFKKGLFTTLSYFVTHEAHHRGRILLTLKVSGHTLDKTTQMTIWGWDQM